MNRSLNLLSSLTLIFCCLAGICRAEELPTAKPEAVGMQSQTLAGIEKVVARAIDQRATAGAVVIVVRRGQVVHFSAQGWQEIPDKPMQRDTIFRIYSMTKPITTVAAMMLWEQGKFDLDDSVAKFLPEFKEATVYVGGQGDSAQYVPAERAMTVRDLMRHTSGLTYADGNSPLDARYRDLRSPERKLPLEQFVRELASIPLKYQPGTRFEYGVSTDVLGRLVEVWSGQPLDQFFAERIFQPLDMIDTGFSVPYEKLARFAANYGPVPDGGLQAIDRPATSRYRHKPDMLSGGGGLVSTARDYSRFCQMLLDKGTLDDRRLLKPETVALMMRNHIPESALPIVQGHPRVGWGFGLGFAVRVAKSDDAPTSPVGECRWGGAASTHFWLSPQDELAVIVMQQHMPFIRVLEDQIKPIVYDAIQR